MSPQDKPQITSNKGLCNALLCLFVVWTLSTSRLLQSVFGQDEFSANVEVHWHDGGQLIGRVLEIDKTHVRVKSRYMDAPSTLDRNAIQTIRMVASPTEQLPWKSNDEIHFKNGSRLLTTIESIQNGAVSIRDPRFGKVSIPLETCSAVKRLPRMDYVWGGNLSDWQRAPSDDVGQSDDAKGVSAWFVDSTGGLSSTTRESKLWLPLDMEESFVIELQVSSRGRPDFSLATGADPTSALRIATIDDSLTLGTADDFEVVGSTERGTNSMVLTWDKEKKRWSVHSANGRFSGAIQEKTSSMKSGILIHNQGSDLTIETLRVLRGSLEDHPDFPSTPQSPSADHSNESGLESTWVRWRDGSRITCESLSLISGRLQLEVSRMPSVWTCSQDAIDRIHMSNKTTSREVVKHTWIAGNNRLSGELRLGDAKNPLLWKSTGQAEFVPLNLDLPQEMKFEGSRKQNQMRSYATSGRDIAYLFNGDVLPCDLVGMSEKGAKLLTSWGSECSVPCSQLKAIELNAKGGKLKHSFTKESRDSMLTFPRQSEISLAPHVLLGSNGDLLRGCVVAISDDAIELDSKQEPMVVDRSSVSAISFLSVEDQGQPEESTVRQQVTLLLSGGFRLTVQVIEATDGHLHCESSVLGRCKIPIECIERVGVLRPELGSDLSPYGNWYVRLAKAPRWSENKAPMADSNAMVGQRVSDFELSSLDGSTFKLSEYAGRVVVLDFWATWCGPCVASLPEYLKVMQQFPATDAVFYGVNSTETPEAVRAFVERKSLAGFNSLFDFDQSLSSKLGVTGIPHTVVIGPNGEVAHVHVGYTPGAADEIARQVRELLPR